MTGERLRLIRASGDGPRGAYLEVDLAGMASQDDPESFAAFYRLFHVSQFLPDSEGQIPLQKVELESREHAEKVSEDLKRAVFVAAESLVSGLLKDGVERGMIKDPTALIDSDLRAYRDAALTGLYRILFILYAEARDPRLYEHRLYLDSYSIHGLVDELLQEPSRDWPENWSGLWVRLKALFRIYDQGLPQITPWENIPPRGGDFFKADTAEGGILDAANLPDLTVARMLLDLTTTSPRQGVGRERVSFRELDIESLGAVYEGLLEYEPRVARDITIELHVQGRTFALSPAEVIRLYEEKTPSLKGDFAIVAGTAAESLHPEAPRGEEEEEEVIEEETEVGASGEEAEEGVKKGTVVRLLRRLDPGAFYFVPGPVRKGSGSFYTPLPLVQDLVRHALGPLAVGKTVSEIETLRILDPACGSAHFLVEAMRFLGRELHRAYVEEYGGKAPPAFIRGQWENEWKVSDEEARAANSEARAWCKRRVAERCLFGIDLNPTAVTLARVALWIESLAGDRPLTFFEHHIRCGNSLLGTWLNRLDHPPLPTIAGRTDSKQLGMFADLVRKAIEKAAQDRRLIDHAGDEGAVEPETIQELEFKEYQQKKVEKTLIGARLLFDLRSASAFLPEIWGEWLTVCSYISDPERLSAYSRSRPWWNAFLNVVDRERFFHWELEFPEVFLDPGKSGFEVVLGNPPWDKIKPDKKEFYGRYDILIRAFVGGDRDRRIRELNTQREGLDSEFEAYEARVKTLAACLKKGGDYSFQDWEIDGKSTGGDPDTFKFFAERNFRIVRNGGRVGLVVPSAIYNNEGCTGLRYLLLNDAEIERFYGFENRKKIFPIHSSYKFVNLVFRKDTPKADGFEAAFMRHDLNELADPSPKPWVVHVKKQDFEMWSPGTLIFPEVSSPEERDFVLDLLSSGERLGNTVDFYAEFHSSNDKRFWTNPRTGRIFYPSEILKFVPADFNELCDAMREQGFWPLYLDGNIHQFNVAFKPISRWASIELIEKERGKPPSSGPKLVVRCPTRNTDERPAIAAVLPARSVSADLLTTIRCPQETSLHIQGFFNSMSFDFQLRRRVAGRDLRPQAARILFLSL